jgi:hypothetical protein
LLVAKSVFGFHAHLLSMNDLLALSVVPQLWRTRSEQAVRVSKVRLSRARRFIGAF